MIGYFFCICCITQHRFFYVSKDKGSSVSAVVQLTESLLLLITTYHCLYWLTAQTMQHIFCFFIWYVKWPVTFLWTITIYCFFNMFDCCCVLCCFGVINDNNNNLYLCNNNNSNGNDNLLCKHHIWSGRLGYISHSWFMSTVCGTALHSNHGIREADR